EAYEHLVDRLPDDWEAWNNLGNARSGLADHQGSIDALQRALALNPESAPTRVNLARELVALDRLDEAEAVLREAVARDQGDKPATIDLAAVLKRKGLEHEVVEVLAKAVASDPDDAALQMNYGVEARAVRQFEIAENAFNRALSLEPANALAFINLATMLDHVNREGEIAELISQATTARADTGVIDYLRALDHRRAGRFREGLAALGDGLDVGDPSRVEFLRGQFHDRLGETDQAFAAFSQMNELLRADPSRPEERATAFREAIRANRDLLTPEWMANWREEGEQRDPRPAPVFLIGFPRSGTTLLDTMLMSHPGIEVLEEEPTIREAHRVIPEFADLPGASDERIHQARDAYFAMAASLTELKPGNLLVDKNPMAMNSLPLIYRLFPDAKVILALRHPCDVVLSCFITNFRLNGGMANFVRLDTTAELYDLSFSFVERAQQHIGMPMHRIVYEDLVANPEANLRALMAFLGVDWQDSLLDHQSTARKREHIKTASYAQVVEPLYTRAAGRWERYRAHLEPVFPVLQPWIEKLGYTL
uniref:tetratricopeptide repeat-containing sulfotransferase family protein n=1 Tax=Sphingomonas sp. TaxID=28214 RepID=UPI00286E56D7